MKTQINVSQWVRRDHFEFFRTFTEPFFGVCCDIPCADTLAQCKDSKKSFFISYLYQIMRAVNQTPALCLRLEGDDVFSYHRIDPAFTCMRNDNTFAFAYSDYHNDELTFTARVEAEIARVKTSKGLVPSNGYGGVVHFSAMPWLNFTAVSHARQFSYQDSCPKISVGKATLKNGVMSMPVSIHAHHALVDGADIGLFFERLQSNLT